jgi:predicted amidohydrolase
MPELTVALLQLTSHGMDQDANLAKGEAACRRARELGADIALFPEMWNIGYTFKPSVALPEGDLWRAPELWVEQSERLTAAQHKSIEQWRDQAIALDSSFVGHFRALARELEMAIALTYLEQRAGLPRNAVSIVDRHGDVVLTYAKVHTCDFDWPEAACAPGDDFPVAVLDTALGQVSVGAMICYDREFPESARLLMLGGAELILTPSACTLETHRIGQFRARAWENMVGVAMSNYARPQQNGHSVAFDPMVIDAEGAHRDTLIVEAGEIEGVYLAPFDLDALRDWRRRETLGNAFRRPHLYSALTEEAVEPPFVRVDQKGRRHDGVRRSG